MTDKEILWIRYLDCGHSRTTNLSYIMGDYKEPKINDNCYCWECRKMIKIIKVRESRGEDFKCIECGYESDDEIDFMKEVHKNPQEGKLICNDCSEKIEKEGGK